MTYVTESSTCPVEGRAVWCWLGVAREVGMDGKKREKPRYECVFFFPKQGATPGADPGYMFFYTHAMGVINDAYRGQFPGTAADWANLIFDCDSDAAYLEKYPFSKGMWCVTLSGGNFQPKVYTGDNKLLMPGPDGKYRPHEFKGDDNNGGDWVQVSCNAYEWSFGTARKGLTFGVEGFRLVRQDDAIGGGGRSVEAMFGAARLVAGGAPPVPMAPAPSAPMVTPPGYGPVSPVPPQTPQAPPAPQASYGAPPPPGYAPAAPPVPAPYAPQPGQMPPAPPQFGQR